MKTSAAHKVESNDGVDAYEIDQILDRRVIIATTNNNTPAKDDMGVSTITTNPKSAVSDYKDFYDDFGTKTTGMYLDGHTEYLVKWMRSGIVRGQDGNEGNGGDDDVADVNNEVVGCPTTWVSKEDLEDRGFMMDIKAYHAGKDTARNNTQRGGVNTNETVTPEVVHVVVPPVISTTTKLSHPKPTKQQQQRKQHLSSLVEIQETIFAETSPLEKICGFSIETESNRFAMKRMTISSYGSCISEKQHSTFLQCVHRHRKTHTPTVLYFGVPASEIPEICRDGGFKMPESISDRPYHQQHGYSHGVGLYAFPDPFMCASYCTPTTTAPPPPTTTTIHQKQPKKPKGGAPSSKPVPRRVLMCIGLVPTDDDAGAAYDENVTVVPDYCVIFNNRDLIVPVWVVDFFGRREGCFTHRSVFSSYESLEYINVS